MIALSAFGSPVSAAAVRPVVHVPNVANMQMSAAAVQGDYDNDGGFGLIPVLVVLGLFVGAVILIFSGNGGGHIDIGQGVSPD
jgi:hypothetical protein